jgi:hypothetical protein
VAHGEEVLDLISKETLADGLLAAIGDPHGVP